MNQRSYNREVVFFLILFSIGLVIDVGVCRSKNEEYPSLPPRIFSSELFPCSTCHEGVKTVIRKRELAFHGEIKIRGHGEPERWCLDCHSTENRDQLVLINSERIDFKDSHRLCGQCHGNIFQDWKAGIHGKRIGYWDGPKKYFLCTYCHNPHSPRFKPLAPEPPPLRPEKSLRR
jgi:hypothetical protein